MDKEMVRRFWSKVQRQGREACWEWTGTYTSKGSPLFAVNGKNETASKVAWRIAGGGKIPAGTKLMRSCKNPRCVNPAHLYVPGRQELAPPRLRPSIWELAERVGATLVPVGGGRYRVQMARRQEDAA